MSLVALTWLFTLGVLAHNTEEVLLLPAWSARAGRWHPPVGTPEFALAASVLSMALVASAAAAQSAGPQSLWADVFAGYVFAMVANVFVPHALGSIALRQYVPGTATALAFNLPLGGLFLHQAVAQGFVAWDRLLWVAPLAALVLAASVPLLFAAGRRLLRRGGANAAGAHTPVRQQLDTQLSDDGTASHFIFYVADQQRSAAFYSAVLRLQPRLDLPGMTEYDLPGGGVLGLMPEAGIRRLLGPPLPDPAAAGGVPRAELYLVAADAASHHARAIAAGASELSPMQARDWGHWVAYSRDPDGHVLAFAMLHPPPNARREIRPCVRARP